MDSLGLLISFFSDEGEAESAFRELIAQGFHRVALLHNDEAGRLNIRERVWPRRLAGAVLGALAAGLLVWGIPRLNPQISLSGSQPYSPALTLLGAIVGGFGGWWVARLSEKRVDPRVLARHSGWVLPGEDVVYLQEPPDEMGRAVAILRESGETQPAIFPIHPDRGFRVRHPSDGAGPRPEGELRERAASLARRQSEISHRGGAPDLVASLKQVSEMLSQVRKDFAQAERLEQNVSVSAEWILDNTYIVEGHIQEVQRNLSQDFYGDLPILESGDYANLPRAYALAKEMVSLTDGRLDRDTIRDFLESYQEVQVLDTVELWALPLMLRIALIERLRGLVEQVSVRMREHEQADFWANRLLMTTRYDPNELFTTMASFAEEYPQPDGYFAAQIVGHLYDEEASLVPVQDWLERSLDSEMRQIILKEQSQQAAGQVSIGNAITTLRELSLLDWRGMFEGLSAVEAALSKDPSGVYAGMDFDTRDRYRRFVELVARRGGASEVDVAKTAVQLARREPEDLRKGHVGYYLIDHGTGELLAAYGARLEFRGRVIEAIRKHHTAFYISAVGITTLLIVGIFLTAALLDLSGPNLALLLAAVLGLLPASQLAGYVVNFLITRLIPPWVLPKRSFEEEGIPTEFRTLVVVPMILLDERTARWEVEKLEIRYLANPEQNLLFGLFSDFMDSEEPHEARDEGLLKVVAQGIQGLNERYGGDRFFLFHRERVWSETEGKYIGWERKRGKLMELNSYLVSKTAREGEEILHVGDPGLLDEVRYVITLDSDTQLPKDSARRLVETLAHPLNQPQYDGEGILRRGYTVIQPRVTTSLPSATATPFSRLFNDPVGTDPYTKAVSDVYQDIAGEGSFIGKGIYDFQAFNGILAGRFPEETLLSHDLLEGAHVRVGLASDIELFDEFPPDYLAYARRQHRWIRGDWQIADWITPWVPGHEGHRVPNPLNLFDRWKIFDNLRRSLVSAGTAAMLLVAWIHSVGLGVAASALTGLVIFFNPLVQPFTWPASLAGGLGSSWEEFRHRVIRAVVEVALLPHRAAIDLDAILLVWYRRLISRKGLLEWTTARVSLRQSEKERRSFVAQMGVVSLFALAVGLYLFLTMPGSLEVAAAFLFLWLANPAIGYWLNSTKARPSRKTSLSLQDREMLRSLARRTWRYFDDFVGPDTHWLPPDNYQMSHKDRLAERTSPTNIGLWLASSLAANDFGYLTVEALTERVTQTMRTLEKLERYEGHLLNWYRLDDLQPLEPRFVSTVDSGNLLASLWTVEQGMQACAMEPLLDSRPFDALEDILRIIGDLPAGELEAEGVEAQLAALKRLSLRRPADLKGRIGALREMAAPAEKLVEILEQRGAESGELQYWSSQLHSTISAWLGVVDRYLSWLPRASQPSAEPDGGSRPGSQAGGQGAITLQSLADGDIDWLWERLYGESGKTGESGGEAGMPREIRDSFRSAQKNARQTLQNIRWVRESCRRQAGLCNMRFLYDKDRRLFSVGYNVSQQRLAASFYDLLASEARLASYVAVARGDAPTEHWLALNRPYRSIGRHRALLSWTGTMFEYLMPALFQEAYPNSLLDQGMRAAVELQQEYGRRNGVPWGISESAFGDLDPDKSYMYQAFGVPELGLKRGLQERLVVAPYASVMALMTDPRGAAQNIRRLVGLGMAHRYGLYEAIDFSRQPREGGGPGVIVHSVMAHHQGMSMLALDNCLNDGRNRRRFHADVRVKSAEPLLYERIPVSPQLYHIEARGKAPGVPAAVEIAPSESHFDTPHTTIPQVHILSNGRYSLMVTNAGGGYSRWGEFDITRWREDTTRDHWGTFCYLRDTASDHLWSATYHPTGGESADFEVRFALDRAVFHRLDEGIETTTEVTLSPEDDVELRQITLRNLSSETRQLEITSYQELALGPEGADRQHPAFNKMFIETEAVPEHSALLAHRRPRDSDDPTVFAGHMLVFDNQSTIRMQYETDRREFIGRDRSTADPQAIHRPLTGSQGFVLDPIFSLRRLVTLRPGHEIRCTMVTAAAETRAEIMGLLAKFKHYPSIERAFELASANARLELRMIRIQPDQARRFRHLAGFMIYPNNLLRPPSERLGENKLAQPALWAYGISGDLPIAAVTIGQERDITLVRQMLQAHTYWRKHGFKADLLILNEQVGGYEQPLHDRLVQMAQAHSEYTGVDQPGGVFVRTTDQMDEADLTLLLSVARVSLIAARGSLAQQLSSAEELIELPEKIEPHHTVEEPSAQLPYVELERPNGIGGFGDDGREYVIQIDEQVKPPAPWINVMANPSFGSLVSESGSGFSWYGNSQRNRLTQWSNDPVIDPPSEAIYVRDEVSGEFWCLTSAPRADGGSYRARHGHGYSIFEHNSHGIEGAMTVFVPVDQEGGDPLRVTTLSLRNDTSETRRLTVTMYAEWTLGEDRGRSQMHVLTDWDPDLGALTARNHYQPDFGGLLAFIAMTPRPEDFSGDRTVFLGRNGEMANPAAMSRRALAKRTGAGLDPCGALRVNLELKPGGEAQVVCLLGQAGSQSELRALLEKYRREGAVEKALETTKGWWEQLLGAVQVEVPVQSVNLLINHWLLYQDVSCRLWGRSAFYQSGGAYGFRDQLQDVLALLYTAPELAKEQILRAAGRQFPEGDVQHWWHPPTGAGVRTRITDDPLWLPYAVSQYVRVTGDAAILDEEIPFLEGEDLEPDQHERYFVPEASEHRASLYEHCRRALERGATSGPHGLPLMGDGDWDDGLNRVGAEGKGESLWLAWFLVEVLDGFAELSRKYDPNADGEPYRERAKELRDAVERAGWDGGWYLRAFTDDGSPLGSHANEQGRIFSLPQSWATIAGAADDAHAAQAIDSAWEQLVREESHLALLFTPPFNQSGLNPGYIQGYPPGVRENGGQYTHGALWLAMALARRGDGDRAVRLLTMLNPLEHTADFEAVARYRVEPYAVSADIYSLAGKVGQGGWTWYTGSAGWMYRIWIEEVLGLKLRGSKLTLDPVIPPHWDGFRISLRHGEAVYDIDVRNPDAAGRGIKWIELDGERLESFEIGLETSAVKHKIQVRMGEPEARSETIQ
jgi:cyclic beta-1,2-glucan synthetase